MIRVTTIIERVTNGYFLSSGKEKFVVAGGEEELTKWIADSISFTSKMRSLNNCGDSACLSIEISEVKSESK